VHRRALHTVVTEPPSLCELFSPASIFLNDDAIGVELSASTRPDERGDHDSPIRQRSPKEAAPLGHRGGVPSRRPFLTGRGLNSRVRDSCRHPTVQLSQLSTKLGNALIQRRHSNVITLKHNFPPTQPTGQLVGKMLALTQLGKQRTPLVHHGFSSSLKSFRVPGIS
jgi:hypothetical protein